MYLCDTDIRKGVQSGTIRIDDFDESRLNPASYDILLGNKFVLTEQHETAYIDPVKKIFPRTREVDRKDDEEFILYPGTSVLGVSHDLFGSDEYLIQLSGKSSLARIGLVVHNTAGIVNPGHFLKIIFELSNLNNVPIILHPKMAIAQLVFSEMTGRPEKNYEKVGRYASDNNNNFASPVT